MIYEKNKNDENLEFHYTEEDLDCTIKSNTNVFQRSHAHSKDIEYYRQSDIDLVYEQIQKVDKFLKTTMLVMKNMYWKLYNILVL